MTASEGTTATPKPVVVGTRAPGLAIASLVLGIVGLVTSVVVIGAVFAFLGLVLGLIHLKRSKAGRMAGWTGVWLSVLAMLISAAVVSLIVFIAPRHQAVHVQRRGPRFEAAPVVAGDWAGQPLPPIELTTLDGETVKSTDWKGRRVVMAFGATWCPPCVEEVDQLKNLQTELGTNRVVIVGVSAEDRVVLKGFARKHDIPYPLASVQIDQLPAPLGQIEGFPTTVFLDESGKLEQVLSGPLEYSVLRSAASGERRGPSEAPAASRP